MTIAGREYLVAPLETDASVAAKAWQVVSDEGKEYHVVLFRYGPECDCGDFVWRKQPRACKHILALIPDAVR